MKEIALIGKKLGMTREFYKTGQVVPVTVLKMEKARVIQINNQEKSFLFYFVLTFQLIKKTYYKCLFLTITH